MFHITAKHLFFTYAQCPVSKEFAYDFLERTFDFDKCAVAEELHQDGSPHLHAYVLLKRRRDFRSPTFADIIGPDGSIYHGNYQSCRSFKAVFKYVNKGGNVKANFTIDDLKVSTRKEIALNILQKRMKPHEAVEEYPQLLFGYKRFKADLEEYKRDLQDIRESIPMYLPNPWGNIFYTRTLRKRRHFWIFSTQPDMGKTTMFALPLAEAYKCALQVGDYSYWNIRGDEECIILDEYNGAKLKYYELNAMCDGTFMYRIFQGGLLQIRRKPLIIVLSNQRISDLYPNMNSLLYARFKEVEVALKP